MARSEAGGDSGSHLSLINHQPSVSWMYLMSHLVSRGFAAASPLVCFSFIINYFWHSVTSLTFITAQNAE